MLKNSSNAQAGSYAGKRMLFIVLPALFVLLVSLACVRIAGPPTARDLAITEATRKAQRAIAGATATVLAPIVQATGTVIAGQVLAEMPQELRPLYERFGLLFVRVQAPNIPVVTRTATPVPTAALAATPTGTFWPTDAPTPTPVVPTYEYWIGLTEVTNAQYRPFVESGGYEDRSLWSDYAWSFRHSDDVFAYSGPGCLDDPVYNSPNQPIACVSWDEATTYTKWLSQETGLTVRLPTEGEWMRAARGNDARVYPWGDDFPSPTLTNYEDVWGAPAPVGIFFAGASPYGALDMSGNLWEWTSSPLLSSSAMMDGVATPTPVLYDEDERFFVKGGTWSESDYYLPIDHNLFFWRSVQNKDIGFRLLVIMEP